MTNLIDAGSRKIGEATVGPLGYGCWRLVAMSPSDAQYRVETALAAGMNLLDTADVYGLDWGGEGFGASEALLGRMFAQAPELRDKFVLATKGGIIPGVPYDSAYLQSACEASLQRMGVEQVDLYQVHRPDLLTHPEETARVLEALVTSGKVRHVGVSNYTTAQTRALMSHMAQPLVTQQVEYSALRLDPLFDGTLDQCMEHRQTFVAWSPLGGGRLATGEASAALGAALEELAGREGVSVATMALAFTLAHPARPVSLVGTINPERIGEASQALTVRLDRADVYRVVEASLGESLP